MKTIKYILFVIIILSPYFRGNPIAIRYLTELYFDSTDWKLEIHRTNYWESEPDSLLGWYFTNLSGQTAYIKDTLLLRDEFLVISNENLDRPFEINREGDNIKLFRPGQEFEYSIDEIQFGKVIDTLFISPEKTHSLCFLHYTDSYFDYSPTLGFENDTLDACGLVTGIVKDSVGNAIPGARIIYSWDGAAMPGNFVVCNSEGKFQYSGLSGRHGFSIDTMALSSPFSSTLKYIVYRILPGEQIFVEVALPVLMHHEELNYFPLEVGNRWDFEVFEWDAGNYSHYDTLSVEVIKDTVMPNGIKYAVLNTIFLGVSEYVRTDPNGIYYYSPYFDSLDLFVFNYYVAPGHSYRIYPDQAFPTAELSYIDTVTIFNSKVNKYRYAFFDGIVGHSIIFADKFGPVEHHTAGDGTTLVIDSKLLGCRISGVVYGKLTSVDNSENSPVQYYLSQNYPNPFNPATTIRYSLPETEKVLIKVYDIIGREIATLVNEEKPAGEYKAEFNASNLSSGIYFYRVTAGEFVQIRKMILLR